MEIPRSKDQIHRSQAPCFDDTAGVTSGRRIRRYPQVSHVMVGGPLLGQMEAPKCEASVKLIACLYHVHAKSIPLCSCHVKISYLCHVYAMSMPSNHI